MSPETQTVSVEKLIKAPVSQAYRAFTNATALKEWLCDLATVDPKPGGRMYLWWNGDFYSNGEYGALEPDKVITFKWLSRIDSVPTQVSVTLAEQDGGTLVTLAHTVPAGEDWRARAQEFQQEWKSSLENLASVLETGMDRRIFDRPMLGIAIGDFTPEQAKRLGVPVTTGLRLDDVVEGMGAHAAGLRGNDVLVSLGGKPVTDYASLVAALQGKKGGDPVEVVFYRGPQKNTVSMTLSRRRVPEVPFDPKELARRVQTRNDESLAALAKVFEGVTDAEASYHPASDAWSAKEVLAHLILGSQFFPNYYASLMMGQEPWSDDFAGNSKELTQAVVVAFPTVPELLEEMKRLSVMLVAFIESWPPEFAARKGSYYRVAWQLLEEQTHTQAHLNQIREAVAAARR